MKKNKRLIIMMASIIMIAAATIAGTLAWLYTNTDPVTNTFTPAKVGNFIDETFENNVKTNVVIYNGIGSPQGEKDKLVDAYIRATYVINWKDTTNNIVIPISEADYDLVEGTENWKLNATDGYYYYTKTVKPGESTTALINSVKLRSGVTAPESTVYPDSEFTLNVEIISQSVQAKGVTSANKPAVEDAWKTVTVNSDGTLNVPQNP